MHGVRRSHDETAALRDHQVWQLVAAAGTEREKATAKYYARGFSSKKKGRPLQGGLYLMRFSRMDSAEHPPEA